MKSLESKQGTFLFAAKTEQICRPNRTLALKVNDTIALIFNNTYGQFVHPELARIRGLMMIGD